MRRAVCVDRFHFDATRLTGASSQSRATAWLNRAVWGCSPSRNPIRSVRTPHRRTVHPVHLDHQPDLPCSPRHVAYTPLAHAVHPALADATAPTDMGRARADLPHPQRHDRRLLLEAVSDHLPTRQPRDPSYDVRGHPPRGLLSPFARQGRSTTTRGCPSRDPNDHRDFRSLHEFWPRPDNEEVVAAPSPCPAVPSRSLAGSSPVYSVYSRCYHAATTLPRFSRHRADGALL